jgi:putative membrane protein insertion efficiency factor
MGYRDSSAQFGGHGRLFSAGGRAAEAAASDIRAGFRAGEAGLTDAREKSLMSWALLLLVRAYITFMSPFFGGACRFHPSCSNYAHEAISRHGARDGLVLAVKRLRRCQPFTKGGFDPVPETIPTVRGVRNDTSEPFAPSATQEPAQ